jgi:hypothetical protein
MRIEGEQRGRSPLLLRSRAVARSAPGSASTSATRSARGRTGTCTARAAGPGALSGSAVSRATAGEAKHSAPSESEWYRNRRTRRRRITTILR